MPQRLIAKSGCTYCGGENCGCSAQMEQEDFEREAEDLRQEAAFVAPCGLIDLPSLDDELTCEVGMDLYTKM